MGYTPVELRHVRVPRRLFGYHRASVEQVMNDVADSFETVWRDRGELADRVERLDQQVEELKGREQVLTNTLVAAESAAGEVRERAKREAELIIAEAQSEARAITRAGQGDRERISADVRRIEALLRSALGLVVEVGEPAAAAPPEAAVAPDPEPLPEERREDTRELRPVSTTSVETRDDAEPPAPVDNDFVPDEQGEQPGWPPLRQVARRGADFDWGE